MNRKKKLAFLTGSFVSSVGDTLLVFSVPPGLGIDTHDIRSAVLMWFIPAVAMFMSTLLSRHISNRAKQARRDYATLLVTIGALEVVVALVALNLTGKLSTTIAITVFIFFYAFAKEGIPRLLYQVSVYRYFASSEEYTSFSALSSGLGIAAAVVGGVLGSLMVVYGWWKYSLLFDALTFGILGFVILKYGSDIEETQAAVDSSDTSSVQLTKNLKLILFTVPLMFGLNALAWNYLPLISERLIGTPVSIGLLLITFLRLPGMLLSFKLQAIKKRISLVKIVVALPALLAVLTFGFSRSPSIFIFAMLIVVQGLISGIYWPSDYTLRSSLTTKNLVEFNTMVVRRLAILQFIACAIAFQIYAPSVTNQQLMNALPLAIVVIGILALLATFKFGKRTVGLVSSLIVILIFSSCSRTERSSEFAVKTFSIANNMTLTPDLTFAAINIINDTSAHYMRMNASLNVEPEVFERFESKDNGKSFKFYLNKEWRSAQGEPITSKDILFSFKYYLSNLPKLSSPLNEISGANECKLMGCLLPGAVSSADSSITITLSSPDLKFVEKLASPWLVVFKADRPLYDKIGTCTIPHQTGHALITSCSPKVVSVKIGSDIYHLYDSETEKVAGEKRSLTASSTNAKPLPTLTSLSVMGNPDSNLGADVRIAIMNRIRAGSPRLATQLHLRHSPLFASGWAAVASPEALNSIDSTKPVKCPARDVKILLDTSEPRVDLIEIYLQEVVPCKLVFAITKANNFFPALRAADMGLAWFTPDNLELSDIYAPFDCSKGAPCYFNWHEPSLDSELSKLRNVGRDGTRDSGKAASAIEEILYSKGYAAPIAEMNWWIESDGKAKAIHPAGLFQLRVRDFK